MPNPNKLRVMIAKRNVSQRELARAVGVEETYLSKMCNNPMNTTENMLKKLAQALNCEVADLI